MRKSDKASLQSSFLTKDAVTTSKSVHVIDGGSFLHKVDWSTCVTYADLISKYVVYVQVKYLNCVVVFDGCDNPSVKDHEHMRRSSGNK